MAIETNVANEAVSSLITPQTSNVQDIAASAQQLSTVEAIDEIAEEQALAEVEAGDVETKELEKDQLEVVVQQLQSFVETLNRGIAFSVDQDSGKDVITVTNRDTGELVRQIPSEEVLLLASRLSEATGLLVNTKA